MADSSENGKERLCAVSLPLRHLREEYYVNKPEALVGEGRPR